MRVREGREAPDHSGHGMAHEDARRYDKFIQQAHEDLRETMEHINVFISSIVTTSSRPSAIDSVVIIIIIIVITLGGGGARPIP